jgi:hypothetical protein
MEGNSPVISGLGNVIGDNSRSTTNVIAILTNRLGDGTENPTENPRRDWAAYVVLFVFVVFCLAVIFSPLWLYPRLPSSSDAQHLVLTISSAMSGVTGLLGVMIGRHTRL